MSITVKEAWPKCMLVALKETFVMAKKVWLWHMLVQAREAWPKCQLVLVKKVERKWLSLIIQEAWLEIIAYLTVNVIFQLRYRWRISKR